VNSTDITTLGTSGYDRIENDFYETPAWCTLALLANLEFPYDEVIWEPSCGRGAISEVLSRAGHTVISSDLIDRGYGSVQDFLKVKNTPHKDVKHIITNPPYGNDAEAFIKRALELMEPVEGSVTMLLRNEYDCAKKRKYLFDTNSYLSKKIVMTKRPRWIVGTKISPRFNYAWYQWEMASSGNNARIIYV